jgi:hypothetical protein
MTGYFDYDIYDDTPEGAKAAEGRPERTPTQKIRSSRGYQIMVAGFRHWCASQRNPDGTVGLPCSLCSRPINYGLPHWLPGAFQAHHDLSVADRPDLILSPANLRPAHARCNQREGRGKSEDDIDLGEPSEVW